MVHVDLIELPREILSNIAGHLDVPSARSLALTCRSLQEVAEAKIWERIAVKATESDFEFDEDQFHEDLWSECMEVVTLLSPPNTSPGSQIPLATRLSQHVRDILDTHEYGLCQPDDNTKRMSKVTEASTIAHAPSVAEYLSAFLSLIPNVEKLRLTVGLARGQEAVWGWTRRPVSYLERHHELHAYRDKDEEILPEGEDYATRIDPKATLKRLPRLALKICFAHLRQMTVILNHTSSTVTYLTLNCTEKYPDIEKAAGSDGSLINGMLKAVRSMENLTTLHWYIRQTLSPGDFGRKNVQRMLLRMCSMDGPGLENLRNLVVPGVIKSEVETYLEMSAIPAVASLEEIIIPCRTPDWDPIVACSSWAQRPPSRSDLSSTTIRNLRRCPHLGTVIWSATSDPQRDPTTWCSQRINGAIIRSYTNGVDEMVHVRRSELFHVEGPAYHSSSRFEEASHVCDGQDDHRWMDQTDFGGKVVPLRILDEIYYEMLGEERTWMTPGRDLELPDEAWALLRTIKKG